MIDEKHEYLWRIDQNSCILCVPSKNYQRIGTTTTVHRCCGSKRFRVTVNHFQYSYPVYNSYFQCGVFTFHVVHPVNLADTNYNFRIVAYCYDECIWQQDIVDCGDPIEAVRSALAIKGHGSGEVYDVWGEVRVYELWGDEVNDISHTEKIQFRYPASWVMMFEDLRQCGYFQNKYRKSLEVDMNGSDENTVYINWSDGKPCLEVNLDYEAKEKGGSHLFA